MWTDTRTRWSSSAPAQAYGRVLPLAVTYGWFVCEYSASIRDAVKSNGYKERDGHNHILLVTSVYIRVGHLDFDMTKIFYPDIGI